MAQKLLVNIAGKQDVRDKARLLLVGEKVARFEFVNLYSGRPLWVRFDDSNDDLACYGGAFVKIGGSDDISNIADALRANNETFDLIAIDTVEQLQRVLIKERLTREGRDYMKGEDYNWMASMMGAVISAFNDLGLHVVLLSGVRHVNPEGDMSYISPGLFGSFAEQVNEYIDYALYYGYLPEVTEVTEDLELVTEQTFSLKVAPDQRFPWIFDSTTLLCEYKNLTINDIIALRGEFIEDLEDSSAIELTIPEDDDNVELPKGMSKADKIQKLLDKGAQTNNKEK